MCGLGCVCDSQGWSRRQYHWAPTPCGPRSPVTLAWPCSEKLMVVPAPAGGRRRCGGPCSREISRPRTDFLSPARTPHVTILLKRGQSYPLAVPVPISDSDGGSKRQGSRDGNGYGDDDDGEEKQHKLGVGLPLDELPLDCLVSILSTLPPLDCCRLALVSRAFSEAAATDALWEQLLPPHYQETLAQADGGPPQCSSKKQLYDRICQLITLKDGTEGYWLDRATGGVCHAISAKALRIIWGTDPRYWRWLSKHGSRFLEVAYLRDVCWFEVCGQLNYFMTPGAYTISFRLQFVGDLRGYGFNNQPVKFMLSTIDGQHSESQRYLDGAKVADIKQLGLSNLTSVRVVGDPWMEYDVGGFMVRTADELVEVKFSMIQLEAVWKRGLFLDGVVIRPSYLVPHLVHERTIP